MIIYAYYQQVVSQWRVLSWFIALYTTTTQYVYLLLISSVQVAGIVIIHWHVHYHNTTMYVLVTRSVQVAGIVMIHSNTHFHNTTMCILLIRSVQVAGVAIIHRHIHYHNNTMCVLSIGSVPVAGIVLIMDQWLTIVSLHKWHWVFWSVAAIGVVLTYGLPL